MASARPRGDNPVMVRRSDRRVIEELVQAQGVERPFRILLRMPETNRLALGRLLGCDVQAGEAPETQSWRLINQNLRGLQARTHHLHEQLTPFSRNNNWWEIVTRTAKGLGLRFYAGLKDEEIERLLFDHFAAEYSQRHIQRGEDPDQFLAELHPNLGRAIASLGLSRDGTRALVAALLRAAAGPPGDPREGSNRLADWLRRAMPWSWTTSISQGLRALQQRLGDIHGTWVAKARLGGAGNYSKVSAALALIYLHDVVERTLAQFDLVGS